MPCDRCGTFTVEPRAVGERRVCEPCGDLLRKELKLYPYVYMNVVGILLNFALAGLLAASNWKRLGDLERRRNALIVAAFGVAWMVALFFVDIPFSAPLLVGIVGTRVATQGLKEPCEQHWREGGARANRVWPVLITLGVFMVMLALSFAFIVLTGVAPEEDF